MLKGVKHIIFDLGGVILNIDYKLTENAFIASGITNFRDLYSQLGQTELFNDFEKGAISKEVFIAALQKASEIPITEKQVTDAWNAMILDFPLRRLQILQQLRLYYDTFLLSNTNEIHEQAFNKVLSENHGMSGLGLMFDKVYFSHKMGMRKPSEEIFLAVLDGNSIKPEHTLFIDDCRQHIEGAKLLGIQTIWLEKGMSIEKDIFKPVK